MAHTDGTQFSKTQTSFDLGKIMGVENIFFTKKYTQQNLKPITTFEIIFFYQIVHYLPERTALSLSVFATSNEYVYMLHRLTLYTYEVSSYPRYNAEN